MGKRSDFLPRRHDRYITPRSAVDPVLPYIPRETRYIEPCAAQGQLVSHFEGRATCVVALEKFPGCCPVEGVYRSDAMDLRAEDVPADVDCIITNPPWTRALLHPMIELFSSIRPTWLLFDADWVHTKQAAPYIRLCRKIVSVGRVSWMENGVSGKDNAAWYLFDARRAGPTCFYGRTR